MVQKKSKATYSRPEADELTIVVERSIATSPTETIVDDPTEHDWD